MSIAVFRADGSQHLGLGHIMRSLAFAQGLEKIGAKSIFVTRDYEQKVAEIIQRYNYSVEPIPGSCSFKEDLVLTSELANQYKAKLVITDLCNVDTLANLGGYAGYLQGLKDTGRFLITIDDLNEMAFPSDIVINPNYGAENMNYASNKNSKFLLGPAYFIFGQEFIEAARVNREIKKDIQNILVTMGGSDLLNLTLKVAGALSKVDMASSLNLRLILGIKYSDSKKQELKETLGNFKGHYELLPQSDSMASLMLWSDLAITGGGLTKYETAVTGTPSIIISQDSYQADLSTKFAKEGSALYLGFANEVSKDGIVRTIEKLFRDDALRGEMSKRGKGLADGRGIERIISEIPHQYFQS